MGGSRLACNKHIVRGRSSSWWCEWRGLLSSLTFIFETGSRRELKWSAVWLYVCLTDYNWWTVRRSRGVINRLVEAWGMNGRDLGVGLKEDLRARRSRGGKVNDCTTRYFQWKESRSAMGGDWLTNSTDGLSKAFIHGKAGEQDKTGTGGNRQEVEDVRVRERRKGLGDEGRDGIWEL